MTFLFAAARPAGLLLCLGLTLWGGALAPASAQPATATTVAPHPSSRPDPLDARASVPPLRYRSVFESYRANLPQDPQGWRQANEAVREAGGWRAYAREAQAVARPPEAASAPSGRSTLPKPVHQQHAH